MSWELELKKQSALKPEQVQKLVTTSLQKINDETRRVTSKGINLDLDNNGIVSNVEVAEVMEFMKGVKSVIAFLGKL